jgi:hypothetical protein
MGVSRDSAVSDRLCPFVGEDVAVRVGDSNPVRKVDMVVSDCAR